MHDVDSPRRDASTDDALAGLLTRLRQDPALQALLAGAAQLPRRAPSQDAIAGDILFGADAIADFLFGDRKFRRKVYNLVESGNLPVFRLGTGICARKSVLIEWIGRQECNIDQQLAK